MYVEKQEAVLECSVFAGVPGAHALALYGKSAVLRKLYPMGLPHRLFLPRR